MLAANMVLRWCEALKFANSPINARGLVGNQQFFIAWETGSSFFFMGIRRSRHCRRSVMKQNSEQVIGGGSIKKSSVCGGKNAARLPQ